VRDAIGAGAAGAISGSAVVALAERHAGDPVARTVALTAFVTTLRAAARI
jgi:tryptophan synthase alpha chain